MQRIKQENIQFNSPFKAKFDEEEEVKTTAKKSEKKTKKVEKKAAAPKNDEEVNEAEDVNTINLIEALKPF